MQKTPEIDDGRAVERQIADLILQAAGTVHIVTSSAHGGPGEPTAFEFREDIVLDSLAGARELIRTARALEDRTTSSFTGQGAAFPSTEVETCMFRPMAASTDRWPGDIVSTSLSRADHVLTVLIDGATDGVRFSASIDAVLGTLWAVTGLLDGASNALARVSWLDIPSFETVQVAA